MSGLGGPFTGPSTAWANAPHYVQDTAAPTSAPSGSDSWLAAWNTWTVALGVELPLSINKAYLTLRALPGAGVPGGG